MTTYDPTDRLANGDLDLEFEDMSLAEQLAILPDEERDELMGEIGDGVIHDPRFWLRPKQIEVLDDDAWCVAYLAGRGTGKTRVGAEWTIDHARRPGTLISLIGRTVADVRDVMINGESGIMALSPPDFRPDYVPSIRRLMWPNGSAALTFSADSPSQLRGTQSHASWCDELAAWRSMPDDSGATAWDHARISTRLGARPQILVTTTPKRSAIIRDIVERYRRDAGLGPLSAASEWSDVERLAGSGRVSLHTGSSFDNRANLSSEYLQTLRDLYGGTALERQELFGELVLLVEEALFRDGDIVKVSLPLTESRLDHLDLSRRVEAPAAYTRLIGVDPGATLTGDATGIIVVYGTRERDRKERKAWIVEDCTAPRASPERWGAAVVDAWRRHSAPSREGGPAVVVAEKNQGGEMVRHVIDAAAAAAGVEGGVPIVLVHSAVSKRARAEPIVLAYRQGRVKHLDGADLEELEDQMLSWEPASKWSPDRMDAMVHATRALLIDDTALRTLGSLRAETTRPEDEFVVPVAAWRRERR